MLTSLDYYHLLKELDDLNGSRLSKIYEDDENREIFLFEFHVPTKGTTWLQIIVPNAVFVVEEKITPQSPPGFCQFLRKKIQGMILSKISQTGFERILKLEFTIKKELKYVLYIEMFSKGNMILTDPENKIIGVWKTLEFKSRNLRGGTEYKLPPKKENPELLSLEELKEKLEKNEHELVKFCANTLGLGGPYSEYLLKKSNLDKRIKKLNNDQVVSLHENLKKLFGKTAKKDLTKISFNKSGNYNEIIAELNKDNLFATKEKKSKKESIINAQEKQMKQFEIDAKINQEKGELIYSNYEKVKNMMLEEKSKGKRKIKVDL